MDNSSFRKFLLHRKARVNNLLRNYLTILANGAPKQLIKAMRYVVLGGGKRLRPLLVYAIGETYKADIKMLDASACAIELIHAFSLVHDDLPAMDNDTLRRGKPTCHIAFDEATAILVGDALAISPFQILSEDKNLSLEKRILMIKVLAQASGPKGMAGGQYIDLHPSKKPSINKLEKMYLLKTGVLISASIKLGTLAANVGKQELELLEKLALNLGLAFQIKDDILNISGDVNKLGKNVGTDRSRNKITYPALIGVKKAEIKVENLWHNVKKLLEQLKIAKGILPELIDYVKERDF